MFAGSLPTSSDLRNDAGAPRTAPDAGPRGSVARSPLPKISVVTPSLNQGRYIEATILSIVSQGYPNFEHIVIDGGSTDETLDILRKYPHLEWVSEPDRGQTDAINKGIERCTGDVFAYLNSDDVYLPGAFQAVADYFSKHPEVGVIVGDGDAIDDDSRFLRHYPARLEEPQDLLRFWEWGTGFCIPQSSVFLRRQLLDQFGLFDEDYDLAMDYEMWLRLAAGCRFGVLHQTLAAFRLADETKTHRHRYGMTLEAFRASRKYARLAPARERLALALRAHREAAGHLLTLAEEQLREHSLGRPAWRILARALRLWPLLGASPRVWRDLGRALVDAGGR